MPVSIPLGNKLLRCRPENETKCTMFFCLWILETIVDWMRACTNKEGRFFSCAASKLCKVSTKQKGLSDVIINTNNLLGKSNAGLKCESTWTKTCSHAMSLKFNLKNIKHNEDFRMYEFFRFLIWSTRQSASSFGFSLLCAFYRT